MAPSTAQPRQAATPAAEESPSQTADFLRARLPAAPAVGFVLGSGFGPVADSLEGRVEVPYEEIPGFMPATVAGHAGRVVAGKWAGVPVIMLSGRAHYYEGHSLRQITFPIRVIKALGARTVVLTAAVGSMRKDFKPASLVALRDHLNSMGDNPLRGGSYPEAPQKFTDLSDAYTPELLGLAEKAARRARVTLRRGVHVACTGPSYETPAEIKAFRKLGGDTVGMSLVPEAIVAKHIGLKVLAIVGVSNYASGVVKAHLTHDDVLAKIGESLSQLKRLLDELLPQAS